jgi:hypothetical protein
MKIEENRWISNAADSVLFTILFAAQCLCWYVVASIILFGFQIGEFLLAGAFTVLAVFVASFMASLATHPVSRHWFS